MKREQVDFFVRGFLSPSALRDVILPVQEIMEEKVTAMDLKDYPH